MIVLLVTLTWHREAARNTIRERGHGRKTIPKRESSDEGSERERDVCEGVKRGEKNKEKKRDRDRGRAREIDGETERPTARDRHRNRERGRYI